MNRTSYLSFFVVAAATGVLLAGNAQSQLGVKGQVNLQPTTPGTSQSGHVNISGTLQAGQHVGGGAGLTNLNASNVSSGALADSRLSTNVALLNSAQAFSGSKTFNAATNFDSNVVMNFGGRTVTFRNDGGLVPGINLAGSGGNLGVLRLRNAMEIWPNDGGTAAGKIDVRAANGSPTITLDGATGKSTVNAFQMPTSAAAGRVLTSDGSGNGSWQAPPDLPPGATIITESDVPPSGFAYSGLSIVREVEWESVSTVPTDLINGGMCGFGDQIYVIGGNMFYRYNATTQTTTQLANVPYIVQGSTYALTASASFVFLISVANKEVGKIFAYNVGTNSWSLLGTTPFNCEVRRDFGVGVVGGDQLLLFGGRNVSTNVPYYSTHLYNGGWQTKGDLNAQRVNPGCVVTNSTTYVFGGGTEIAEAYVPTSLDGWFAYGLQWLPESVDACVAGISRRGGFDELVVIPSGTGYRLDAFSGEWKRVNGSKVRGHFYGQYQYTYSGGLKRTPLGEPQFLHKKL